MWSRRQLAALALLPAGTIVGHAASYLLAGRHSHAGVHGYLDLASWPIALAALSALACFACSADAARFTPRVAPFAAAQLALFLVQESAEGLLDGAGVGATLVTPTVRYGVAIQLVLALGVVLLARLAAAGGARLRATLASRRPQARPAAARPPAASRHAEALVASPASERGPPALLIAA